MNLCDFGTGKLEPIKVEEKEDLKSKPTKTPSIQKRVTKTTEKPVEVCAKQEKEESESEKVVEPKKSKKQKLPAKTELADTCTPAKDVQILTASTTSNTDNQQTTNQQDQVDQSQSSDRNQSQEQDQQQQQQQSSNERNSQSSGDPNGNNNNPNSNLPSYWLSLPTFFDEPPPPVYEGFLEVQVKKEKRHPKIYRKLVPTSNTLERKSQLFLEGALPIDKPDFSLGAAQRKIKNLKRSFLYSGHTINYTVDTFEKAKAKDFKNILIPAALLSSKQPAFEYQYIIEDPKTGLFLSTDEIQSIYSPEELERLLQDLSNMDKEVSFSSRITTTTTKRVKGKPFHNTCKLCSES